MPAHFLTPLATALAGALVLSACGEPPAPPPAPPRPVKTVIAGAGLAADAALSATHAGIVQARHESKLGFQTGGKVVARLVEVGQRVKRGQPLMRLDPAQQSLQLVSSTAHTDGARSRVEQLKTDVARTEQLLARQFASQAELDQQRLALAEAESSLRSALARQQIDANQRGYTELVADRDGVVSAVHIESGQVVAAGQTAITLAGNGEREVLVSVPESRIDELRHAKALQVRLWAKPGRAFTGSLRELAPDSDPVSRTYSARIAVRDGGDDLMLGMTASVFIPDAGASDRGTGIRLPLTAVQHKDGRPLVWLVDTKTARVAARDVTLAAAQGDVVLIRDGLAGGETVVVAGGHLLHPGQVVRLTNTSSATSTNSATKAAASGAQP